MSATSARRQLQWILEDQRHYVTMGEFGWTLMHPLSCRATPESLMGCAYNAAMGENHDAVDPGRYLVTIRRGHIVWGKQVEPDFDPIVRRLERALEELDNVIEVHQ